MSKDDACDRAKRALMNICGEDEDRFNTVFLELAIEQGSVVRPRQINRINEWAEDLVYDAPSLDGPGLPKDMRLKARDVFVVRGDERDEETKALGSGPGNLPAGEASVFDGSGDNRIHVFFPFENNTMTLTQLGAFKHDIERAWEQSNVSSGRIIISVNVVDPAVAYSAAPQRTGRPMEDVERF